MTRWAPHTFRSTNSTRTIYALLLLIVAASLACEVAATGKQVEADRHSSALTKAHTNIQKYRQGDINIKVVDSQNRPMSDVQLEVTQISHSFKFGCYLKIDDLDPAKLPAYERDFKSLFNYAVIGTYWDFIENKKGVEDWSWFGRETDLAKKIGVEMAAAPVLWGTSEYGTPKWLPTKKEELWFTIESRVKNTVGREAAVNDWEIVNEPLARKRDVFEQLLSVEYIAKAFSWAKEAAPKKRLMINEYGVFGSLSDHNYNRERYFRLLENLIAQEVPIDVIGIQAHANGEWFGPANVAEQLEKYAELGLPIQITEFSVQTSDFDDPRKAMPISGSYRTGVWNAEKQAEFYREFYTIAFANPQVEAIVTWGLDDERAWLPGVGLIASRGNRKPAYRELDRLINREWKTTVTGMSARDGKFNSRGYFGKYEVTSTARNGKKSRHLFDLARSDVDEWLIRLQS